MNSKIDIDRIVRDVANRQRTNKPGQNVKMKNDVIDVAAKIVTESLKQYHLQVNPEQPHDSEA